ncbi:MAG: 50S ribosomal protein L9 [Flavobacteriales bacterium TMED96]|jgi:large subunit ribosomal protein L9|nr:MAG: 50S ribosomal protein L9 [Flavobacteriales bacterium TMED96]
MELILKEDIDNLGFKDEVVVVKNGYGRNFLIPTGKAVLATDSAKKVLAENLKQQTKKNQKLIKEAEKLASDILKIDLKIPSKVGEEDKLFGSITSKNLSDALSKEGKVLDKKYIIIPGRNIKRLGNYEATLRLHKDVVIKYPFEIIAETNKKKDK